MSTLTLEPGIVENVTKSSIFFNDVMKYMEPRTKSQKEAYRRKAMREIRTALKTGVEF